MPESKIKKAVRFASPQVKETEPELQLKPESKEDEPRSLVPCIKNQKSNIDITDTTSDTQITNLETLYINNVSEHKLLAYAKKIEQLDENQQKELAKNINTNAQLQALLTDSSKSFIIWPIIQYLDESIYRSTLNNTKTIQDQEVTTKTCFIFKNFEYSDFLMLQVLYLNSLNKNKEFIFLNLNNILNDYFTKEETIGLQEALELKNYRIKISTARKIQNSLYCTSLTQANKLAKKFNFAKDNSITNQSNQVTLYCQLAIQYDCKTKSTTEEILTTILTPLKYIDRSEEFSAVAEKLSENLLKYNDKKIYRVYLATWAFSTGGNPLDYIINCNATSDNQSSILTDEQLNELNTAFLVARDILPKWNTKFQKAKYKAIANILTLAGLSSDKIDELSLQDKSQLHSQSTSTEIEYEKKLKDIFQTSIDAIEDKTTALPITDKLRPILHSYPAFISAQRNSSGLKGARSEKIVWGLFHQLTNKPSSSNTSGHSNMNH